LESLASQGQEVDREKDERAGLLVHTQQHSIKLDKCSKNASPVVDN